MVRHRRGDEFPTLIKPIAKLSLTAAEPTMNHWMLWITWALSATCSPSKGLSHLWPRTTLVGCRLVMWREDYVGSCWTCPVLRTVRWSWSPEPAQCCLPCPATEGLCPCQWRHWPQSFAVTVLSQMAFHCGAASSCCSLTHRISLSFSSHLFVLFWLLPISDAIDYSHLPGILHPLGLKILFFAPVLFKTVLLVHLWCNIFPHSLIIPQGSVYSLLLILLYVLSLSNFSSWHILGYYLHADD